MSIHKREVGESKGAPQGIEESCQHRAAGKPTTGSGERTGRITDGEAQKFTLLGQFQPFDPILQSSLNVNRYSSPTYSQLQGVGVSGNSTLNALSQTGQVSYTQTFTPGTNIVASISSNKFSTNSSYDYFNPYFSSTLNFTFTQPLLRGAGRFANTALIKIARRSLEQSRSNFEAEVNDVILNVVSQYWSAVQARGALDVQNKSLNLAEASYERDKRSLELGALPPLDIYRSQSEVAARKVEVIQAAYQLTQAEEALRLTIGADRDPQMHALELNLTEKPQTDEILERIDVETALSQALSQRRELDAVKDALSNDDTSIRLARNHLKPNLQLQGFYQSSGLGGNQYDLLTGELVARGGFGSSMNQLFSLGYPLRLKPIRNLLQIKTDQAADAVMWDLALLSQIIDVLARAANQFRDYCGANQMRQAGRMGYITHCCDFCLHCWCPRRRQEWLAVG